MQYAGLGQPPVVPAFRQHRQIRLHFGLHGTTLRAQVHCPPQSLGVEVVRLVENATGLQNVAQDGQPGLDQAPVLGRGWVQKPLLVEHAPVEVGVVRAVVGIRGPLNFVLMTLVVDVGRIVVGQGRQMFPPLLGVPNAVDCAPATRGLRCIRRCVAAARRHAPVSVGPHRDGGLVPAGGGSLFPYNRIFGHSVHALGPESRCVSLSTRQQQCPGEQGRTTGTDLHWQC